MAAKRRYVTWTLGIVVFLSLFGRPLPAAADDFVNSLGMRFVLIPAGTFSMGAHETAASVATDPKYGDRPGRAGWYRREHPLHEVTLGRPFLLQSTEVTVGQFRAFVAETGYRTEAEVNGWGWAYAAETGEWVKEKGAQWRRPGFAQTDAHPVTFASWHDTQAFIQWLNRREKTSRYRLPTEAEWEHACRAGTRTPFYWGRDPDGRYANFADGSFAIAHPEDPYVNGGVKDGHVYTAPVGSYLPNPFGLYDMSGNVNEWCRDWYGEYTAGEAVDPQGPPKGTHRVLRGGSWCNIAAGIRSANRGRNTPGYGFSRTGFRLAWTF